MPKRIEPAEFVKNLIVGEFAGKFYLEWRDSATFNYMPDKDDPFRFIRYNKQGQAKETITPESMITNGGSIPRIAWPIPGLGPWEYGPAYMIHDWEFETHYKKLNNKTFEEVNLTLAEAIKTLMTKGYNGRTAKLSSQSNYIVYSGVMTDICRNVWNKKP